MKKTKSEELFDTYYAQYSKQIESYCNYKLKSYPEYAQECVQDTFTVLFEKLNDDVQINYVKAFLFKTADNFVKKKYRELNRVNSKIVSIDDMQTELSYEQSFFEDIDENLIISLKEKIINSLTPQERELLYFTCKNDSNTYLTTKELAEKYHCSETNIRQKIFILRTKIKKKIKENVNDL